VSQVRIALTGAHGTGKTYIVTKVKERLEVEGLRVALIESPTRYVKSLGFTINQDSSYAAQLLSGTIRTERQLLAASREDIDVVLADRCLADELGYNIANVTRYHRKGNLKGLQHLHYADALLREFFAADIAGYWDEILFQPPHPDFPPEEDGDRPTEVDYWHEISGAIKQICEDFEITGRMPLDRDEGVDVLYDKVDYLVVKKGLSS